VSHIRLDESGDHALLAIEAAWSTRQSGVEPIKVVRRPDKKNPIISLQPVQLIQEERAVLIIDQTIEVFEDDDTRRILSGLPEHFGDGVFISEIVLGKVSRSALWYRRQGNS
jgi:hypothetical protein